MADRQKTIKGMESLHTRLLDAATRDKIATLDAMIVSDALALLKAQEPIEPSPAINNYGDWLCGKCYNSVVGTEELDEGGFVPIRFNYCPNCGQAVKWE